MIRLQVVTTRTNEHAWLPASLSALGLEIVAVTGPGEEALAAARDSRPQAVAALWARPTGQLGFLRRLQEELGIPALLLLEPGSLFQTEAEEEAVSLGAARALPCPPPPGQPGHQALLESLAGDLSQLVSASDSPWPLPPLPPRGREGRPRALGVASSTGGPQALGAFLSLLPAELPAPILIVQHLTPGFEETLRGWLDQATPMTVTLATHGVSPRPGWVYLAPPERHLTLQPGPLLHLDRSPPKRGHRPSADRLFHSLAEVCGEQAVGIVLTGMGDDGAEGLSALRQVGALTLAQSERSSLIHGMPGEAIARGAARLILDPPGMARAVLRHLRRPPSPRP